ncbi:MAG: hypothetical protein NC419_10555, partial [Muribaculaceae bacterium]|nr:hypothetical protein [Muribaculaceae bacterium]
KNICYLNDQTWYDADYFKNAVTASGEERFNIKMVFENQAMDTHPPLYYLFMNLICSIFDGQYSKWFGIGLNIILILIMEAGLYLLLQYFIHNRHIALSASVIFCCSRLAVSMTLFIRMYVLLMVFTVFTSLCHLRLYDKITSDSEFSFKKYLNSFLILSLLTIAGALTHYYFLVYQALISALFIVALFLQKKYRGIRCYLAVMLGNAIIYIAIYPASINHIFFKYRGRDAVHKFLKESSLFGEVYSMFSSFNKYLFKGLLPAILFLLMAITILLLCKKKINWQPFLKLALLLFPSLIYFYGISKASPYITMRYISPVAAFLYAAIVIWGKYLADAIMSQKIKRLSYGALCSCLFATTFYFLTPPHKGILLL